MTQTLQAPEIDLFPYNLETYLKIKEIWTRGNKASAIQATGTGKTYLILKCIYSYFNQKTIVLAPTNYILDQLSKKAKYNLPNVELMTYAYLSFRSDEEIATMNPTLIVLDEFHRCGGKEWGSGVNKLIELSPDAKVLGVTATPVRYLDDERDMSEELFDGEVAVNLNLAQAIVREILPMPKYISALYTFDEEVFNLETKIEKSHNSSESKVKLLGDLNQLKQKLENSKGVPNILQKHLEGLTGGKFVLFCKDSNHMNKIKDTVVNWFIESGIGQEVETYSISSKESGNTEELEAFANNVKTENVRLLFTINMLNEGVHIDDVTGVILLRPTTSPIIHFQQIGRSFSAGQKNQPLIFDLVNNFNNLGSKTFKDEIEKVIREENEKNGYNMSGEIIEVEVNSVKDEEWNEENKNNAEIGDLDEVHNGEVEEFRECQVDGHEKLNEEIKHHERIMIPEFYIYDETQDIIEVFQTIEDQLTDSWDSMFEKYKNGDYDESDLKMESWIKVQRKAKNDGRLEIERERKLNSIKFVWDVFDYKWNIMFEQYKNIDYKLHDAKIISWTHIQIKRFNENELCQDRVEKLNSINFIWDRGDFNWNNMFEQYKNNVGKLDGKLKAWIGFQRSLAKKNSLEDSKYKKLESIGFFIKKGSNQPNQNSDPQWENMFEQYKEDVKTIKYVNLGKKIKNWISIQRRTFKNNKLMQSRIDKLESIGFLWEPNELKTIKSNNLNVAN